MLTAPWSVSDIAECSSGRMDPLLVLADDHSDGASTAWEWVCAQGWPGWSAEILTVDPRTELGQQAPEPSEWEPAVRRVPYLTTALTEVRHIRAWGDPRVVLAGVDADLLVIGPRGAGLGKKLHLGSVAEWLLDCPRTPTIIAKQARPVERVALAVDGSRHARAAAETLGAFPWISRTHIDIIAVEIGDGCAAAGAEEARDLLLPCCASVTVKVIRPYEWDLTINVRGELMNALGRLPYDLLALGTRGLQGWERLRVGSTADYLAHHVECSVLLTRCASD